MFEVFQKGLFYIIFPENTSISLVKYYSVFALFIALAVAVPYLLGSINSAIIISKTLFRDDIRKHGSGNPGLTNMLRTFGKKAAVLTLFGDMLKTALGIFLGGFLFGFNYNAGIACGDGIGFVYLSGLFAVLGHVFPIYYRFKGGKGVLSTATMALIYTPIPFLILLLIFILIVAMSKYVSLGSVSVAVLYPVVVNGYFKFLYRVTESVEPGLCALTTIAIAVLVVWCHRENLKRISDRTERKISFKSKKENSDKE